MRGGRVAESTAKFPGEVRIVAKAAGIGHFAAGLACSQQLPPMQKARGVI
jgi:hypothetical protein